MSALVSGSNALAFFVGLNWDRELFLAAVSGALTLAAIVFSFESGSSVFI